MIQTLIKTAIRVFFSGTIYGTRFRGSTDTQATLSCREKRIEEPVKKQSLAATREERRLF